MPPDVENLMVHFCLVAYPAAATSTCVRGYSVMHCSLTFQLSDRKVRIGMLADSDMKDQFEWKENLTRGLGGDMLGAESKLSGKNISEFVETSS